MRVPWTAAPLMACFAPPSTRKHAVSRLQAAPADESLESLATKVEEALEGAEEQTTLQLLNSRLDNLSLNRTYVGPSLIAGRGLFASVDCPAGTLLTCYPGDGMVDEDEEVCWGDHVVDRTDQDEWDANYLMYVSEEIGLIGLPELDQDPAYLGHFCNDGASKIPTTLQEALTSYLEDSQARANAEEQNVLNCHISLVATKDIQKDEEIFLCYGPEYWMQQPGFVLEDLV